MGHYVDRYVDLSDLSPGTITESKCGNEGSFIIVNASANCTYLPLIFLALIFFLPFPQLSLHTFLVLPHFML